jgi:4a-hydroxytetrahydrobiopterin dehydratase
MTAPTRTDLADRHCRACEGGVPKLAAEELSHYLSAVPGWALTSDSQRIARTWKMRDFAAALDFFNEVAKVAEEEDHHPDLHLTGYRNVTIEISTHAVGGLTENDFILAAKIDQLPKAEKK